MYNFGAQGYVMNKDAKVDVKAANRKVRKNWALPDATLERIDAIRQATDASTDTEVIKRALKLYDLAVRSEKAGLRVVFKDDKGNESSVVVL
jgi:hypothetical protein